MQHARSIGSVVRIIVRVLCGLALSLILAGGRSASAQVATTRAAVGGPAWLRSEKASAIHYVGGPLSQEEKARIGTLPEAELVKLAKTGKPAQRAAAVGRLIGAGNQDLLLSLAKAGVSSDSIVEVCIPNATEDSDARTKAEAELYLAFLEEQLKAAAPVVRPAQAVRSLARLAYWAAADHGGAPLDPPPPLRYQHQRILKDLIGLLKDKRVLVRLAAVRWLGCIGGYTADGAEKAAAALKAYRKVLAARAPADRTEQTRNQAYLRRADGAIDDIRREQRKRRAKQALFRSFVSRPAARPGLPPISERQLLDLAKQRGAGRCQEAVKALLARDKGDALLAIAKAGSPWVESPYRDLAGNRRFLWPAASEIIIDLYVPTATAASDAGAKASVDAYLGWLEEQLKAKSPVIRPYLAVRSLARVAYCPPAGSDARPAAGMPGPPYQCQRVVADLVGLLKDKRPMVSDEAAKWLGVIGGHSAEQTKAATTALEAYRKVVAAEPASGETEQRARELRLGWIDQALKDLEPRQDRRGSAAR